MKAPRCPVDGLFMRYEARSDMASTVPWGEFWCKHGHLLHAVLPWPLAYTDLQVVDCS